MTVKTNRSYPTFIITQEPRQTPRKKGPFYSDAMVEEFLREAYRLYPEIICIVVTDPLNNGWYPEHGYEWLDENGDRRRRHPRKDRPAPSVAVKGRTPKLPPVGNELYEHYPAMSAQTHAEAVKNYARAAVASALSAQVQDVAEVSPADYMRRHDAAVAAYEANTPSDYRYSALALRKAVDAAFAIAAAPAKQEGESYGR